MRSGFFRCLQIASGARLLNEARSKKNAVHILLTLSIGGITGLIVRWIMPGREPRASITSAAIGVVGAIIADYAIHQTDCCIPGGPVDLIGATVGALILLNIDRFSRSKPQ